jgi:hypothetical protein
MIYWRFWGLVLAAIVVIGAANPAAAEPRNQRLSNANQSQCVMSNSGRQICSGPARMATVNQNVTDANGSVVARASGDVTVIGGRPAGCPHQYCGCGLRLYHGLDDKRLNLASNWMRLFPRVAGPAAGVAAVRSGHVMYIEGSAGDGQRMVRDYNSGGGLSRLHIRSVRGFVFVNPRATIASNSK